MKRAFIDTVDYSSAVYSGWHGGMDRFDSHGWIDDVKHLKRHHLYPEQEIIIDSIFDTHARVASHWNSEEAAERRHIESSPTHTAAGRRVRFEDDSRYQYTASMEIAEECMSMEHSYDSYSNMSANSLAEHNSSAMTYPEETSMIINMNASSSGMNPSREIHCHSRARDKESIKRYFPVLSHKHSTSSMSSENRRYPNSSKLQQLILNPMTMALSRASEAMETETSHADMPVVNRCNICMFVHQHGPELLRVCSYCYQRFCMDRCGNLCYDCQQECCSACLATVCDHGFDRQLCCSCKQSN
jgi:hypothetical protein